MSFFGRACFPHIMNRKASYQPWQFGCKNFTAEMDLIIAQVLGNNKLWKALLPLHLSSVIFTRPAQATLYVGKRLVPDLQCNHLSFHYYYTWLNGFQYADNGKGAVRQTHTPKKNKKINKKTQFLFFDVSIKKIIYSRKN